MALTVLHVPSYVSLRTARVGYSPVVAKEEVVRGEVLFVDPQKDHTPETIDHKP